MDRRSWPWRKKTIERNAVITESSESSIAHSSRHCDDQDARNSIADHAQMSEEGMVQLQESEEKVKRLNEKLSVALSDVTAKDNLVKQHAKVAEEAVSEHMTMQYFSGQNFFQVLCSWEKAEAEAMASKQQVESLTQQKLALEDRVSHLDGALKECMRQLRHVREDQERKINEVSMNKTRAWDIIRSEFEAKIMSLEQQLLQAEAENTAISRSLQERSKTLSEIMEAKVQAEAEVKVLQVNIESYESDNAALKYELHVLSKELEIRNEERNLSMKSAEAASKQHMESVKKIAKLEAECQKLRGLVRKKLPGPAAMAQMRMEVETLGKESGDVRRRRSPSKGSGLLYTSPIEPAHDNAQEQDRKDFLTERLLTMEEETKMLKEALAKRNSELQASRVLCAKTASKLSSVEKQLEALNNGQKPQKPALEMHMEGPRSQTTSNPPSLTSMSEDGNDDEASYAESWASALISELSHIKKEKGAGKSDMVHESRDMDLMDDFMEMERLASLPSSKMNQTDGKLEEPSKKNFGGGENNASFEEIIAKKDLELQAANKQCLDLSQKLVSTQEQMTAFKSKNDANETALAGLQERLDTIFGAQAKGANVQKALEDVKLALAEAGGALGNSHACNGQPFRHSLPADDLHNQQHTSEQTKISLPTGEEISLSDAKTKLDVTDPDLETAVSRFVTLVQYIVDEAKGSHKCHASKIHELNVMVEKFSATVHQISRGRSNGIEFVSELASVLAQLTEICNNAFGTNAVQNEVNVFHSMIPDVNKSSFFESENYKQDLLKEDTISIIHSISSYGCSNADVEHNSEQEEKEALESEVNAGLSKHANLEEEIKQLNKEKVELENQLAASKEKLELEEQITQLNREKVELENQLVASKEKLELTKHKLTETEKMLADMHVQLASAQELKQLAESQLEIMASSKQSLELHLKATENEMRHLSEKVEALESKLQEEHKRYVDAETKCRDLQDQLQRREAEIVCSQCSVPDNDSKMRQEREIAAAAEKLAECQQTILVLGRQLKALSSPKDSMDFLYDVENVQSSRVASSTAGQVLFSKKDSCDTKRSRHQVEVASDSICLSSERDRWFEHGAPWSPNGRSAPRTSEPEIAANDLLKTGQWSGGSSGRTAPDLYKHNQMSSPIHVDYNKGHLTMPGSSETEVSSPVVSPVKSMPSRNRLPHSLPGNALSSSLNEVEGQPASSVPASEKHGTGFSRFFSKTRSSH